MTDSPPVTNHNNQVRNGDVEENDEHEEHDPYFEPVIYLPEVHVYSMEEDEDDLVKLRAKLFRYDKSETPYQWKERGTGEIKILCHRRHKSVRVLMRRDRTWKICANHYITPCMKLKPNCDSDRAWIWSVPADFADETPKPELLAVRFANAENANKFKEAFEEAQRILEQHQSLNNEDDTDNDDTTDSSGEDGDEEEDNETTEVAAETVTESKAESEVIDKLGEMKVGEPKQPEPQE